MNVPHDDHLPACMPAKRWAIPSYRHVSWCYDALASAYSLGAIDRAKRHHRALIKRDDRVLYAGAGRGREIVGACRLGAEVTCVEPCPAMAGPLHRRLADSCDGFTLLPRAIQQVSPDASFDWVVAHFFLNVFDPLEMPEVLTHLCRFVKPGGRLVIADFAPSAANAGLLERGLRAFYYRPLNLSGWALRICSLHPIYNYAPLLIERGFITPTQACFSIVRQKPQVNTGLYHTITATRPGAC